MRYKLVIFDLDGTILNTLDDLTNSLNYALLKSNLPKRKQDEVRSFLGDGIKKLVERGVPKCTSQETINTVLNDFIVHYKDHNSDYTKPYDGIINLLNILKEKGVLTAVVSNKADYAVQILCNNYFRNSFDVIVGEKPEVRKKPAPDAVLNVLDQLNISRQNAIYIGDSEVDILTAANAGMDCICVDWGFRTRDQLIKAGAKKIVSEPEYILKEIF